MFIVVMIFNMSEKIHDTDWEVRFKKAKKLANFVIDPEKLARITSRTLHSLSLSFLKRQEKEQEKIMNNRKSGKTAEPRNLSNELKT